MAIKTLLIQNKIKTSYDAMNCEMYKLKTWRTI